MNRRQTIRQKVKSKTKFRDASTLLKQKRVWRQSTRPSMLSARARSPCEPWGPGIDRCLVGSDWTWVDNFLCCIRVHYWPAPRKAIDILKKKKKINKSWGRFFLEERLLRQPTLLALYYQVLTEAVIRSRDILFPLLKSRTEDTLCERLYAEYMNEIHL